MQNVCRAWRSMCEWVEWEWGREGGLLSGWKKVGLGYIRTILLKRLKQLKAGILHIHSEGKLIKSQRDRGLRTLCSTPFVRDSLFIKLSLFLAVPWVSCLVEGACRERHDSRLQLEPTAIDTAMEREHASQGSSPHCFTQEYIRVLGDYLICKLTCQVITTNCIHYSDFPRS